jgi:hypothetical protein
MLPEMIRVQVNPPPSLATKVRMFITLNALSWLAVGTLAGAVLVALGVFK